MDPKATTRTVEMQGSYLVIGGTGGIGAALTRGLCADPDVERVIATRFQTQSTSKHEKLSWMKADMTDEVAVQKLMLEVGELDGIINCMGYLHEDGDGPEKSVRQLSLEKLNRSIALNAWPTMALAKYATSHLKRSSASVFCTLSARVGSIEDNRLGGWYGYRASKAALNMFVRTLAVQWQRSLPNCCVVALHPGTVATSLSAPFTSNVRPEQLFSPDQSAAYLLDVLDKLTPENTGSFLGWDGIDIPW